MAEGKRINVGARLMPATVEALDAAGERMGHKSRAFVIEVLAALYASQLNAETRIPVGLIPSDSHARHRVADKKSKK